MKLSLTLLLTALLAGSTARATHTLEELWFGSGHTYGYHSNDSGFVCGAYVNSLGIRQGFVMTPDGHRIIISPSSLGGSTAYTECAVTDINNKGIALLHAANATTSHAYRGYYDPANHEFSWELEPGLASPVCNPLGINADSAIAGWYSSTATMRFAFIMHKNPPAGQPAWQAHRFDEFIGGSYYFYATWGTDISNDHVVGYYLDNSGTSSIYKSFRFDMAAQSFQQIGVNHLKIHGIDAAGTKVVGEQRVSGVWKAFWADVSAGGGLTMHSLASLFDAGVTHSVARGINEKGEITGYYLHPDGTYRGFIYRKDQPEYRLPGFDFMKDTWQMRNASLGGLQDVWTPAYWGGNDYDFTDPYVPLAGSVVDANPFIKTTDSSCPTWLSFMREWVGAAFDQTTDPGKVSLYKMHLRPKYLDHWAKTRGEKDKFGGFCFGFCYTALMKRYNETEFVAGYGTPATYDIDTVTNSNVDAIRIIERTQLRQNASGYRKYSTLYGHQLPVWQGLYRLKMTFGQDEAHCNPRDVAIIFKDDAGAHAIMPYKIRTPQTLPFSGGAGGTKYDTLFLYDPNFPGDSTTFLAVGSYSMFMSHDTVFSNKYNGGGWFGGSYDVSRISFNRPGIRGDDVHHNSQFKTTAYPEDDSMLAVALKPSLYFEASGAGGNTITLDAGGFSQSGDAILPVRNLDIHQPLPLYYEMDTLYALAVKTHDYADSVMWWNLSNTSYSMGIARKALPDEADNGSFSNHRITYGTHDAAPKTLSCWYRAHTPDYTAAANIMVDGLGAADGDSLHTESLTPYTYTITKITGVATTYDLHVYASYGGTVVEATAADVPLSGGATHTVEAYFPGPAGPQVAVLIDNGSDGVLDDTLFVATETGLQQLPDDESGFLLYPNPASEVVYLETAATEARDLTLSVVDAAGRTVLNRSVSQGVSRSVAQIPVGTLAPGTYVVRVVGADGQVLYRGRLQKH